MVLDLTLDILSNFKDDGFKEAEASMDGIEQISSDLGLSTKELNKRMDGLGLTFDEASGEFETFSGKTLDADHAVQALASDFGALQGMSETTGHDIDILQNRLDATETSLAKNSEGATVFQNEFTGAMDESALAASKVSNQLDTFNQEALSALFGAIAVGQQMSQLTEPAFEAAGVFDLITNTLKIFFLPIALEVRDFILKIRDRLLGLPPGVRKVIGAFVILIGILAKVGAVIAGFLLNAGGIKTILLGIGGTITSVGSTFAGLASTIASVGGTIVGILGGPITAAIAIVIAAILAFKFAWERNLFGIRQLVGGFVKMIGKSLPTIVRAIVPVIGVLDLLIKAVNRLFDKDIDTLGEKFRGLGDKVAGAGQDMIDSGEKFDKMNKKAPDPKEVQKDLNAGLGGSKVTRRGSQTVDSGPQTKQVNNSFKIETKEGQSERKVAREVTKMQKRSKDNTTREP